MIYIHADLFITSGYSKFSREYTYRLLESDIKNEIKIIFNGNPHFHQDRFLIKRLEKYKNHFVRTPQKVSDKDITLSFYPPIFNPNKNFFNILYTMMDSHSLRENVYEDINKNWDHLFVPSNFVYNLFSDGINKNKLTLIPLGVDTKIYNRDIEKNQKFSFKLVDLKENKIEPTNQTPEGFRFLNVSRFSYRKGSDLVLRSYCEMFSRKDNVSLVLFWSTDSMPQKMSLYKDILSVLKDYKNKNIAPIYLADSLFSEATPTLPYSWGDCFIFPSRGEGFGLPPLEASACGLPLVCSDSSSLSDYINNNTAEVIPHGELDSIGNIQNEKYIGKYPGWKNEHFHFWQLMGDSLFPKMNSQQEVVDIGSKMLFVKNNYSTSYIKDKILNLNDIINKKYNWDSNFNILLEKLKNIL